MQDVEVVARPARQLEHQREVGVVLRDLDVRRSADVVPTRVLGEEIDRELRGAERRVRAGCREQRDLVTAPDELAGEVPRHRLQATGEGLADGEAAVGDQADPERCADRNRRHRLTCP